MILDLRLSKNDKWLMLSKATLSIDYLTVSNSWLFWNTSGRTAKRLLRKHKNHASSSQCYNPTIEKARQLGKQLANQPINTTMLRNPKQYLFRLPRETTMAHVQWNIRSALPHYWPISTAFRPWLTYKD